MAETTQVLTAGDVELRVEDLPAHIQRVVALYDHSQAKKLEAEKEFVVSSAASRQLLADITRMVQEHLNAENAEEEVSDEDESDEEEATEE